ncbi:MAG: DoxX family protein [Sphingomonadaceae bacterium]
MQNLSLDRYSPIALAALRIMAGLLFLSHGLVKLFGFPAGAQPGVQPLMSLLGAAAVLELIGGLLIILGLFTRPVAFLLSGQMAVAYFLVHAPQGFHPVLNGGEASILFCFIFLYLAAAGGGAFSLDGLRNRR